MPGALDPASEDPDADADPVAEDAVGDEDSVGDEDGEIGDDDVDPADPVTAGALPLRDGAGAPLSPGTSDATSRLPDGHHPSAGVLVIRGSTWTWRTVIDASVDNP